MRLRRLGCLLVLLSAFACATPWNRHRQQLAEYEQAGDWNGAMDETKWMIDNSMLHAPPEQRSPSFDADRYLQLADYATRAGNTKEAVAALRQALFIDPTCAPSVRKKLERLPLPPAERRRVEADFQWNMAALAPDDLDWAEEQAKEQCWSYRVRQIRIRHNRVEQTERGKERKVVYDARHWRYDAPHNTWVADGGWVNDAGEEIELLGAPEQPRYRAIVAANGGFYSDSTVPPCHRHQWTGPLASDGTLFVARQLPQATGE